jgi:YHS domain-containing protein
MHTRWKSWLGGCVALAAVSILMVGCAGQDAADAGAAAESPAAATEEAVLDAETEAALATLLAKVDMIDGAEDHVISKCPGCGLQMDGSADHAIEIVGYNLHFCSADCKGKFEENTAEMVLAMEIPMDLPAALPE